MLVILTAWLIPHQIANSSVSVVVILTALWIILIMDLLCEWICDIDMATWFLMLVLDTTIEDEEFDNALNMMSLRFLMWFLIFEEHRWKENQSGKRSMSQFPRLNFLSKAEKKGKSLLYLLSMLIREEFRHSLYLEMRLSINILWGIYSYDPLVLRIDVMIWLERNNESLKRNLSYNFLRWRWIEMRSKMASIPIVSDVLKILDI